jgi:hypothetical protein
MKLKLGFGFVKRLVQDKRHEIHYSDEISPSTRSHFPYVELLITLSCSCCIST